MAFAILPVAWLLADQHHARPRSTFTHHRLRRAFV
jgi:hypothetical protein